jgi:TonB family protein
MGKFNGTTLARPGADAQLVGRPRLTGLRRSPSSTPMRLIASFALSLLLTAPPLAAQLVQGQVVARDGKRPLVGVRIALLDEANRIVREASSDSTGGYFFIDAPRAGRYQLATFDRLGNSFASSLFVVESGATVERQLMLPELPASYDGVPVAPTRLHVRGMPVPRYPDAQRRARHSGTVRVAFIVDAEGSIEPGSVRVISSTHDDFTDAVTRSLERLTFVAASTAPRPQRVIEQLTFAFGLPDAPFPPGDIQVTAVGIGHVLP